VRDASLMQRDETGEQTADDRGAAVVVAGG
jgi:hypothetical protein